MNHGIRCPTSAASAAGWRLERYYPNNVKESAEWKSTLNQMYYHGLRNAMQMKISDVTKVHKEFAAHISGGGSIDQVMEWLTETFGPGGQNRKLRWRRLWRGSNDIDAGFFIERWITLHFRRESDITLLKLKWGPQ